MFKWYKRFFQVLFTEWKLFYTDSAALLLVAAGVFYAFYYPTPYMKQTVSKIPVGIVDLDHSFMSRQLTQMSKAAEQIDVRYVYTDIQDAKKALAKEEIYGFMVLPHDMEKTLQTGGSLSIPVFTHGAYVMLHGNIGTAFTTVALTMGATVKVKRIALSNKVPAAQAMVLRDPIPIRVQTMFNNTGSYSNYVVPGVLVLILQQTLVIGICILGGARAGRRFRFKNAKQQTARECARIENLEHETLSVRYLGRAGAYFLHYCTFIAFYHFIVYSVFDFPRRGDLSPLILFAFLFLSASIHFGMVISNLFSRRETAMQIFLYLSIPFLFLSSFSWPTNLIPEWMQWLSYLFPSTFAVPAWISIEQRGADILDAATWLYPLAIQSSIYLILGVLLTHLRDRFNQKYNSLKSDI